MTRIDQRFRGVCRKAVRTVIEPLESRIAPAALAFVNPHTATYSDVDGDAVTVHFSNPILTSGNVGAILMTAAAGAGFQLQEINLTGIPGASGTDISVTVKHMPGGDGLAAVGYIDATGIDLGTVSIHGDLSCIDAGSNGTSNVAIKSLSVVSMGLYGTASEGASPSISSYVMGQLGSLTVATNIVGPGISLVLDGTTHANDILGRVVVRGELGNNAAIVSEGSIDSVSAGSLEDLAFISASGDIGPVRVAHSINSSYIESNNGSITSVKAGGSLDYFSQIMAQVNIGSLSFAGDIESSIITAQTGTIGSVKATGMVMAPLAETPSLLAGKGIGPVTISGDLYSAVVSTATGKIASLTVGGSLDDATRINAPEIGAVSIAGDVADSSVIDSATTGIASIKIGGNLETQASISSNTTLASLSVAGQISGSVSVTGAISTITAGSIFSGSVTAGSIGSISVGGNVINGASIDATGSGGITSVKIGGSLAESSTITSTTIGTFVLGGDLIDGSTVTDSGSLNSIKIGGDVTNSGTVDAVAVGLFKVAGNFSENGSTLGSVQKLLIGGDVFDCDLTVTGVVDSAVIGGSLTQGGHIGAGMIDSILIGRNLNLGGSLAATVQGIATIHIGGSIDSGTITSAGEIGLLTVAGKVFDSSQVQSSGNITTVKIGGSLDTNSTIQADGNIGSVTIGVQIDFGSGIDSETGGITSVKVGGSVYDSFIDSMGQITAVSIGGPVAGGSTIQSANANIGGLTIGGSLSNSTLQSVTGFGSIAIGGSVISSNILAGVTGTPGAVTVGPVTIGGDWVASSLSAGCENSQSDGYGNADNTLVATSASITSISIAGTVAGTSATGDHFGFDSGTIGSFKIGGFSITLPAAPSSTPLSPVTGDVDIVLLT